MKNKEYRELQISSSSLIFIFLAIIILGIIIFLLGVSVGKKQTQIVSTAQLPPGETIKKVTTEKPEPVIQEPKDPIDEEIEAFKENKQKEPAAKPIEKKVEKPKPTPPPPQVNKSLFYIQVGAYRNKTGAETYATELSQKGYDARIYNPGPNDRNQLYKIRVGGFNTRAEAEQVLARLAVEEGKQTSDYFIIQR